MRILFITKGLVILDYPQKFLWTPTENEFNLSKITREIIDLNERRGFGS